MFRLVCNRRDSATRHLLFMAGVVILLPIAACNRPESAAVQAGPRTFASPQDAGTALVAAAKAQSQDQALAIFGSGSADIVSSGDVEEDKASLNGFAKAYEVTHRWRKLSDGSQLLLVGADNETFPVPLMKNPAGQWYFDAAAGKEEILARRIGRDEIAAINVCAALADAQIQYFSQKHGGVRQYAQKFISDPGEQNGLYWQSSQGSPRSPLGPLVAFATDEGLTVKPDAARPFYGYYFRRLETQGSGAQGGAESYLVDGKMTRGFAYVAYPAKYNDTGINTFIIDQDQVVYEKNLGQNTADVAKAMTQFDPDSTWTAL